MSDHPKALLVITAESPLSDAAMSGIHAALSPVAVELGMLVAVLPEGLKAEVHRDLSTLVEAIQAQTHAISQLVQQNAALIQAMAERDERESPDEHTFPGTLSNKRR